MGPAGVEYVYKDELQENSGYDPAAGDRGG